MALQWVRDNMATFGGDPEKITIFGKSDSELSSWDIANVWQAKALAASRLILWC